MIYFIRCATTARMKIGYAGDAWRRFAKIQSDSPGDLEIVAIEPGEAEREAELHRQFADLRVRGEWFTIAEPLAAYVAALGKPEKPQRQSKTREFWNGWTAADVGRATGYSAVWLHDVQNGHHRPSPERAITIQRVTGLSAIKLVFGDLADEAA